MRFQGKITDWNDEKGFGFVTRHGSTKRIFIHITAFERGQRRPEIGDIVTYREEQDERKGPRAATVQLVEHTKRQSLRRNQKNFGDRFLPMLACSFLFLPAIAVVQGRLHVVMLAAYFLLSIVSFYLYRQDKIAAQHDRWRTPEATLHLVDLLGGWPGALIAQRRYRHKSSKSSFQMGFWITVFLNCTALGWLTSQVGRDVHKALLA